MTAARADARRNREIVLRTAVRVFAEDGLEVSLGRIAARAGVGAGTVYRHFPSKAMLLEAVLAEHIEGLANAADRWATRAAPGAALHGFLLEVIEKSAGRRLVCDALTGDRGWPRTMLTTATGHFHESMERLLRKAKQAGASRPDLTTDDLTAVLAAGTTLRTTHRDRARAIQLIRLLLDGLRPVVTEPSHFRDGVSGRGHETTCAQCGAPLPVRPTGRPARYCGPTCRQRAHRATR